MPFNSCLQLTKSAKQKIAIRLTYYPAKKTILWMICHARPPLNPRAIAYLLDLPNHYVKTIELQRGEQIWRKTFCKN